ncbi:MAG: putative cobaltochelatase [Chloroflexi bacterium AL-W]|nr:putative cobaltochelatase [Chloroflexi bacterium AL-N1]NOK65056.1 putative cobaltochelatase [Chloroflexi bacterium AL-N10]NOK72677.1 putative cobaltochelatase [Chloroflexi bacterium AL-N5]NOK79235.1 putative cobaltochelatase [Chloroflexi bacterium AL-W]NOK87151.1 putative cobaltochelatase [Chloroflexi bacterium AL-N15]
MAVLRPVYPFTAIVGQERLKRALILNTINSRVGGVLIRGEKGTAKSTAVRGLARLLPHIDVVADCPYSCPPDNPGMMCETCRTRYNASESLPRGSRATRLVELPVAASEDRVVGSLDIEHALTEGQRRFEPGLLAQANRGILYVDEVNLLDDHLVDILLDAAAMGINTVEREGISITHPASFMLVGTMNPEEGELRPQLLDRFGLVVEISGVSDVAGRVAVIERRMAYDANPTEYVEHWQEEEQLLAQQISAARAALPTVRIERKDMVAVAALVLELGVDGHRADLAILEAARTQAAWQGHTTLTVEDIRLAAELALPHRMRRQPFTDIRLDEERMEAILERVRTDDDGSGSSAIEEVKKKDSLTSDRSETVSQDTDTQDGGSMSVGSTARTNEVEQSGQGQGSGEKLFDPGSLFQPKRLEAHRDRLQRRAPGKRSRTRTTRKQGRYITSRPDRRVTDVALDATLREAAPYQQNRRRQAQLNGRTVRRVIVRRSDLRQKIRARRTRNAVCFVVDASWSMAAEERMRTTKAAVLALLRDAYQRRDRVGLISFQRDYATLLLPLTNSVELAQKRLHNMPTGGKTPLSRGLLMGYEVLDRARRQDAEVIPLMVILTDGQANVSMSDLPPQDECYSLSDFIASQSIHSVVLDTEHPVFERGLARQLAHHLQGSYYRLDDIREDGLASLVQAELRS